MRAVAPASRSCAAAPAPFSNIRRSSPETSRRRILVASSCAHSKPGTKCGDETSSWCANSLTPTPRYGSCSSSRRLTRSTTSLVLRRRPAFPSGRLRPVPGRPQVIRFQPIKPAPRRLGKWVDRSLARQVLRAATRAEIVRPTLWINDLGLASLATVCSWPVLYDVTDDWLAASASPRARERAPPPRGATPPSSRRRCGLLARTGAHEGKPADQFGSCPTPSTRLTSALRSPRPADLPAAPVAVYVGTLHDDRIDIGLVLRTAESFLTFSSCSSVRTRAPRKAPNSCAAVRNIHLLGARALRRRSGVPSNTRR